MYYCCRHCSLSLLLSLLLLLLPLLPLLLFLLLLLSLVGMMIVAAVSSFYDAGCTDVLVANPRLDSMRVDEGRRC